MNYFKAAKQIALSLLLILSGGVILIGGGSSCYADNTEESQFGNYQFGADPHDFVSADKMYLTGPLKEYDDIAGDSITTINQMVVKGFTFESIGVRKELYKLNPYRKCEQVQDAVKEWISMVEEYQDPGVESNEGATFYEEGNTLYRNGDFDGAIEKYTLALQAKPYHFDARNNLALSELHRNEDLTAQLNLECLRKQNPGYIPSLINLTVVYERLHQSGQAELIAREAYEKCLTMPSAAFNLAWYKHGAGDFREARNLLIPWVDKDVPIKYKQLMQASTVLPDILQTGLIGHWGGRDTTGNRVVFIIIFGIISLFLCILFIRRSKVWTFIACGLCYSILYLISWGIPAGSGWIIFASTTLFISIFYSANAKR